MASITNTTLSSISSLLGNGTTAKSVAKNTLTNQSSQLASSLLGTSDSSNLSAAGDALIRRTHNKIDARRKELTQQGESVIVASDLLEKAGKGSKATLTALSNLRKLAVEAAKPETTAARRAELQTTFNTQITALEKTVADVQRDGKSLLTGTFGTQTLNIGTTGSRKTVQLNFPDLTTRGLKINNLSLASAGNADTAVASLDSALRTATSHHSKLQQQADRVGTVTDTLISTLTKITTLQNALSASTASSQAQSTSSNDLLSAFYPSSSLSSSAQNLL